MTPPANHEALNTGIAWFQLVFGSICFVRGLRGATRYLAPMGLMWLFTAVVHFLDGHVSDTLVLTVSVPCFVGVGVWWWRKHRAHKVRERALLKQRPQSTL